MEVTERLTERQGGLGSCPTSVERRLEAFRGSWEGDNGKQLGTVWHNRILEQERERDEPERPSKGGQTQPAPESRRTPIEVSPPPARRGQSGLVVLNGSSPPRVIIGGPSARMAQHLISLVDGLEAGLRRRARVQIWMTLLGAAVIRRSDLVGRYERIDAQTRVIPFRVHFGHGSGDRPSWGSGDVAGSHRQLDISGRRWPQRELLRWRLGSENGAVGGVPEDRLHEMNGRAPVEAMARVDMAQWEADLSDADRLAADVRGANLSGADLCETALGSADLTDC